MTQFLFHCHPADLEAEGPEAAFSRLRGEIGVDGVVIDAVAPARLALRPRVTEEPKIVSHEAAAWFQPEAKCYATTRIRPNTAKAIKSRNALGRLCEEAGKQGLSVRLRIDPLDSAVLADRHPSAACVDVYGRPHDSRLCPSNADVREYVAAVVEDVSSNFGIESIELTGVDFGPGLYAGTSMVHGLKPDDVHRMAIHGCYCPACRQRAADHGADPDEAAASVRQHLTRAFGLEFSEVPQVLHLSEQSKHLAGYMRNRIETVTSLMKMVRRRVEKLIHLHASGESYEAGLDCAAVAEYCDGYVLAKPCPNRLSDKKASEHLFTLNLACHPPHTADGPGLVSAVREVSGGQYDAICFSDYGLAPEPCLEWVRQAIRFARRESA